MKLAPLFFAVILLASCTNNIKRITIFGRGSININYDDKTITVKDDGPADDKTGEFRQAAALNLTIKKPSGNEQVTVGENGLYVVNAKKDTVIGIYQNYDTKQVTGKEMSQDDLKKGIDSLIQLTENKNISNANRNFFILPYQAVKITDNIDATIVPPFQQLSFTEQTGNKKPEVYRFYNISEIRETIAKLQLLTIAPKKSSGAKIQTIVIKHPSEKF